MQNPPSNAGSAQPWFALQQPLVASSCLGLAVALCGAELRRAGSTAPSLGSSGKCWQAGAAPGHAVLLPEVFPGGPWGTRPSSRVRAVGSGAHGRSWKLNPTSVCAVWHQNASVGCP